MADVVVDTESKSPKELLGQGIRAYVLQDYSSAVSALSKASELLVAEHGDDLHDSLADVYLYYGKALLGLSREESEALGDAVPKNNDEESDDEDEVENTETEEGNENKEAEEEAKANGDVEMGEVGEQRKDKESEVQEAPSSSTVKEGGSLESASVEELEKGNDDEPTDLQVAWEVLELAKKIYEKHGEDGKKNLAETLTVLGEISLESENFEAAVNDIKQGLEIQKELFGKDSRTVAETYYKLGVAYSTNSQIDEAIQSFTDSLEYLQNRIRHLEKVEDRKDEVEEELKEIKNLIPDVEEKIADMKSYKDEVCQCDIRKTIRDFVSKPNFGKIDKSSVNQLQVKRKPSLEAALKKINL